MSKRKKSEDTHSTETSGCSLIFPGPERWELWRGTSWERLEKAGMADEPREFRNIQGAVFCFPTSAFASLPLWSPLVDGISSREQAALNLEVRGLLGSDPGAAVWAVDILKKQPLPGGSEKEFRELHALVVLQPHLPAPWMVEGIQRYEIAGRLQPAPGAGSTAMLRRELGRWVLDLYENGRWLHSQGLLALQCGEEAFREIQLLFDQFIQEEISPGWKEIVVNEPVPPGQADEFVKAMDLRLVCRPSGSTFVMPEPAWDLLPREVADSRMEKKRRQKIRKMATAVFAGDLVVWLGAILLATIPQIQIWNLEKSLAPLRPKYRKIFQTQKTWEELRSLTDPHAAAIEVLHAVSAPLLGVKPRMAIKLTEFVLNPAEVVVRGVTGENEQVVVDFLAYLSQNPRLSKLYHWPTKAQTEPQGKNWVFTITATSTAPQPEKKEKPVP